MHLGTGHADRPEQPELADPLPAHGRVTAGSLEPSPFALELDDGSICRVMTGTIPAIDPGDVSTPFGCGDEQAGTGFTGSSVDTSGDTCVFLTSARWDLADGPDLVGPGLVREPPTTTPIARAYT